MHNLTKLPVRPDLEIGARVDIAACRREGAMTFEEMRVIEIHDDDGVEICVELQDCLDEPEEWARYLADVMIAIAHQLKRGLELDESVAEVEANMRAEFNQWLDGPRRYQPPECEPEEEGDASA